MEALCLDSGDLSEEAYRVIDELEGLTDNLFRRIDSPLKEMHKISKYYDYDVKLRYRKRGDKVKQLVKLTRETSSHLTDLSIDRNVKEIDAIIMRYHSKTGNGRLYVKGHEEFYSFGYGTELDQVKTELKRKISENLHVNNAVSSEEGTYMKLRVMRKLLPSGDVIKFLVVGVLE